VLGGPREVPLLGMVTLETLGLMLNPLTRELLPMNSRPSRREPPDDADSHSRRVARLMLA
jgi:hypothetical protein